MFLVILQRKYRLHSVLLGRETGRFQENQDIHEVNRYIIIGIIDERLSAKVDLISEDCNGEHICKEVRPHIFRSNESVTIHDCVLVEECHIEVDCDIGREEYECKVEEIGKESEIPSVILRAKDENRVEEQKRYSEDNLQNVPYQRECFCWHQHLHSRQ